MTTQTHPQGNRRVLEKFEFRKFSGATKLPTQQIILGFQVAVEYRSQNYPPLACDNNTAVDNKTVQTQTTMDTGAI